MWQEMRGRPAFATDVADFPEDLRLLRLDANVNRELVAGAPATDDHSAKR
jgi:hypothetical protein